MTLEEKTRGGQAEKLALSQKAISTLASCGKRMRFWTFTDAFGSFTRFGRGVNANSHVVVYRYECDVRPMVLSS